MPPRSRFTLLRLAPICAVAALCLAPLARAQSGTTITATATVKTRGGVTSTAPLAVMIDRFSSDSDRDAMMAAIKSGGTDAVRGLLLTRPPIGTLKLGDSVTSIKYVYERSTPEGRLITAVTGSVSIDGQPVKSGSIAFFPIDEKSPTTGASIADGQYTAQVPLGAAKVQIRVAKKVGEKKLYNTADSPVQPIMKETLPARYNDDTELQLDVKPGNTVKNFELATK
jgi:hypothetical protein